MQTTIRTSAPTPPTGHPPAPVSRGLRTKMLDYLPLIVLIGLTLILVARDPGFLSVASGQAIAVQAAPVLVVALGLTPVILLGSIDLSVAALTALSSILLVKWVTEFGALGLLAVIAFAAAVGAVVGVAHAKGQAPSFIITLGALSVYAGAALTISNGTNLPLSVNAHYVTWVNGRLAGIPASFLVGVAMLVILAALLKFTPLGRYLYSIGAGEPAALMSGVPVVRVRVAAFSICAVGAALAAILTVGRITFSSPTLASNLLLTSIAAVVAGGTAISGGLGSVWKTLVGVLTVTVVQVGMVSTGIDPVWQNVVFGAVIITAVALTTDRNKLPIIK